MRFPRFIKAQIASLLGASVDFLVTISCVEVLHGWYVLATVLGNAAGGITNFYLVRHFVFHTAQQGLPAQSTRYFVVWLGSMLLNATGVYLLTQVLQLNYLHSKIVTSLLVSIGFNYSLQRYFVFKKP